MCHSSDEKTMKVRESILAQNILTRDDNREGSFYSVSTFIEIIDLQRKWETKSGPYNIVWWF